MQPKISPSTHYFPSLQIARGVAALAVLLNHAKAKKDFFPAMPRAIWEFWFNSLGVMGLTIFFCLSGFLITHLLLKEQLNAPTHVINLRRFYIKRALRILPLYGVVIILGHFLLPFLMDVDIEGGQVWAHYGIKTLLFLLVLPNYVLFVFKPHQPFTDITWSIGVEEQFYLAWPFVVKKYAQKLLPICAVLIVVQISVELACYYLDSLKEQGQLLFYTNKILRAIEWTRCGYFAIGAAGAVVYTLKKPLGSFGERIVQWSPWLVVLISLAIIAGKFPLQMLALGLAYGCFQLKLVQADAANPIIPSKVLWKRWLEWVGAISYGVYMYHCFVIVFVYKAATNWVAHWQFLPTNWQVILLHCVVLIITLAIAQLSFQYLESYFLRLKNRWKAPSVGNSGS